MSLLVKKSKPKVMEKSLTPSLKLEVKDTDFLLRLIQRSTFDGNEVEACSSVIKKLSEMHRRHLES